VDDPYQEKKGRLVRFDLMGKRVQTSTSLNYVLRRTDTLEVLSQQGWPTPDQSSGKEGSNTAAGKKPSRQANKKRPGRKDRKADYGEIQH